ncbi:MAG: hypothetical protein WCC10_08435 [Tumebacillaceae bacterium]
MNKKFSALLVCGFVLSYAVTTTGVHAATSYPVNCGTAANTSSTCNNSISVNESETYFTHTLSDYFRATDAYHIYFSTTTFDPGTVYRGSPVFEDYYVNDNYNSRYTTFSDYYGKYLSDYGSITMGVGITTGYGPNAYQSPTTNLYIQNQSSSNCSVLHPCREYISANQFKVN